jgi:hypothetical protein
MRKLFTGRIHVHYGQFYVESRLEEFGGDLFTNIAGQSNGLCGAAVPGFLFLITARHTGQVDLAVELLEGEPAVDDAWEDVVEASFRPASPEVWLMQWAGEASWRLDLDGIDYRVRYSCLGMDAATELNEDTVVDRYLLQFWPAPPLPDRVHKQTTSNAAYYNKTARDQPPLSRS